MYLTSSHQPPFLLQPASPEMICHRCLLRAATQPPRLAIRTLSTTSIRANATPVTAQTTTATNPRPHDAHPAATSTSAAQPFSDPLTPSPDRFPPKQSASKPRVPSSVPAGTPLKGLNFLKTAQDPIAKEDHEYPEWLWGVLEKKSEDSGAGGRAGDGDLFCEFAMRRVVGGKLTIPQQSRRNNDE